MVFRLEMRLLTAPSSPQAGSVRFAWKPWFYPGLFDFMANYVYILQSLADGSFYKGCSQNPLQRRLTQHNNKLPHYASSKVSWKLIYIEFFKSKTFAIQDKKLIF